MEIREGIRYQPNGSTEIFKVVRDPNSNHRFCGEFTNGLRSCSYNPGDWRKDFKSGTLKLIEYPYKVGDWVVITRYENGDPENTVIQIECIRDAKSIDYRAVVKKGMFFGASFGSFRPAFKDEIPKSKQKVVKENYDYLIPILIKLDE